ncbi:hypothetical protein [Actinokineospora sp. HUAS TT18]|uniref:hypothetical protein n=1 Tax=Actinokineospora sp. HUAS TT18 TaxID=3447451 RepID=UPI003F525CE9
MNGVRRRGPLVLSGLLGVAVMAATPAFASWSSTGIGAAGAMTGALAAPTNVSVPAFSSPNVLVGWTASSGATTPSGYYVTRTAGGGPVAACASSPSSLIGGTSCTDTGVANGAYTYAVTAVYRTWTALSTAGASVTVTTATALAFSGQPSTVAALVAITPAVAVRLKNSVGTPVSTAGVSVTIAIGTNPSGGTLSGTATAVTNESGVATFAGLSINKAGAGYTLTATAPGMASATSSTFIVTFGTATQLAVTQSPTDSFASTLFFSQPVVTIQDAAGNTVTNATTTVTVTAVAEAGLTCAAKAAVNGIATFTGCLAANVGTYTLTSGAGGLAPAASASFAVVAAPTNLAWSGPTAASCLSANGTSFALEYGICGVLTVSFTAGVSLTNGSGAVLTNLGPAVTVALAGVNGGLTTATLSIPHGATVSTTTVTFTLGVLAGSGGITASLAGKTSATATLARL